MNNKKEKRNKNGKANVCLNCENKLSISDNYCSNCGQINDRTLTFLFDTIKIFTFTKAHKLISSNNHYKTYY